jgi:hypothetical protein
MPERNVLKQTIRLLLDAYDIDKQEYERAVENASEEDLEQLANLDKRRLKKWVESPDRIRPYLLKKWRDAAAKVTTWDKLNDPNSTLCQNLKQRTAELRAEAERIRNTRLDWDPKNIPWWKIWK